MMKGGNNLTKFVLSQIKNKNTSSITLQQLIQSVQSRSFQSNTPKWYEGKDGPKHNPNRPAADHESPYVGNLDQTENTSGVPDDSDEYWDNAGYEKYHRVNDYPNWIPTSHAALEIIFYLGLFAGLYTIVRYLFISDKRKVHHMTGFVLNSEKELRGKYLNEERKEKMKEHGITEKDVEEALKN